jgi:hypothetical protein
MGEEHRFNVVVFDADGYWHYGSRDVEAREAVETAKELADLATTPAGVETERVMITDSDDYCCFLWERGKGVMFPRRFTGWQPKKEVP